MAIKELNENRSATWSLEQKDRWWLERSTAATCRSSRSAPR